jgi:hypothetical protein
MAVDVLTVLNSFLVAKKHGFFFITQSILTTCVSVRPSPIQLPTEQRHRIIKYNVNPHLNKEYNCVNCNLQGHLTGLCKVRSKRHNISSDE